MKKLMRAVLYAAMLAGAALPMGAGGQVAAQEAASSCATKGTAILKGIPDKPDLLVPSMRKNIAGYGRQAKQSGCKINLVCVAKDGSDATREYARQQCVVARDVMVRAGFVKANVNTSRRGPGDGFAAGNVHLTVY
jgi:hypothetical protein